MNKVTVTGNIVSRNGVTLFFIDGTSQVLPSDGFKTQAILDKVLPSLAKSTPVEIDLDDYSIAKVIEVASRGAIVVDKSNGGFKVTTAHGTVDNAGALRKHVEDAAQSHSARGFRLFMNQFGEMAKSRKHSADELLTFMEGADLPIADEGSLIGYKILTEGKDGWLVDSHSGKVKQKLGSLVFMPASKVDDNRRLECSVGLHIAARSYIGDYWGSNGRRLCLVKIKPGDVISVPTGERSKMRVCAYHIVAVLDETDGEEIAHGKRIEDVPGAAKMLANVVAGNHPGVLHRVEITEKGVLTVTKLAAPAPRKTKPTRSLRTTIKVTVAKVKAMVSAATPYDKKLARAQALYDKGWSIREISPKLGMDRESLGRNLRRKAGR